jgi:hypothetical protein
MGNSKASSVAPLTALESPGSLQRGFEQATEQPRNFHFAVTWVTLFAHLDPIEAAGPTAVAAPRPQLESPAPTLALVPVVASSPVMDHRPDRDSNAAWEMVVPKMIRTGPRTFVPAEGPERSHKKPELL